MFSAGTYFALPIWTLQLTDVVFSGVGIRKTTSFAFSFGSKFAFRCIEYSTRDFVGSTTCVCSLNGKLMLVVERYLNIVKGEPLLIPLRVLGHTSSTRIRHLAE